MNQQAFHCPAPIKILVVFGTRPEAIKLAPLIQLMQHDSAFELKICNTAQHRQMVDHVLSLFEMTPDYDLAVMRDRQNLSELTCRILQNFSAVWADFSPDWVIVHGDTTTALAASLSAFYQRIPIAHVEAGLRTFQPYSPFPEEANRRLIASLARWHFAPTPLAKQNLLNEGVNEKCIWVTGNTVIDAMTQTLQKIQQNPLLAQALSQRYAFFANEKKTVLITRHRRENRGKTDESFCQAIVEAAEKHHDVQWIYPVHPHPELQAIAYQWLDNLDNVHLLPPQDYVSFVYLMQKATLILTDSGGIQEEATALGKTVLLMREHSERLEALEMGNVKLIGTEKAAIVQQLNASLAQPTPAIVSPTPSPYGTGQACQRIVDIFKREHFHDEA